MSDPQPRRWHNYGLFLAASFAVVLLLVAAGYLPTLALAGPAGPRAMLFACGVTFLGSAGSGLPIALARTAGVKGLRQFFLSMGARLVLVVGLAVAAGLLAGLDLKPFVLWLGISYLALLGVDSVYASRTLSRL